MSTLAYLGIAIAGLSFLCLLALLAMLRLSARISEEEPLTQDDFTVSMRRYGHIQDARNEGDA